MGCWGPVVIVTRRTITTIKKMERKEVKVMEEEQGPEQAVDMCG